MIEVNVHNRNSGEVMQSHVFPTIIKANKWINTYHASNADANQLRLRTLPDAPKSKRNILAIAIPIGLTAIGICYYLLHKL